MVAHGCEERPAPRSAPKPTSRTPKSCRCFSVRPRARGNPTSRPRGWRSSRSCRSRSSAGANPVLPPEAIRRREDVGVFSFAEAEARHRHRAARLSRLERDRELAGLGQVVTGLAPARRSHRATRKRPGLQAFGRLGAELCASRQSRDRGRVHPRQSALARTRAYRPCFRTPGRRMRGGEVPSPRTTTDSLRINPVQAGCRG